MKGSEIHAFDWETWYASVGGRSIRIDQVDQLLAKIREDQYPRFHGVVNEDRTFFNSPEAAARCIKEKAFDLGADEVGIAAIEASDIRVGKMGTWGRPPRPRSLGAVGAAPMSPPCPHFSVVAQSLRGLYRCCAPRGKIGTEQARKQQQRCGRNVDQRIC